MVERKILNGKIKKRKLNGLKTEMIKGKYEIVKKMTGSGL